MGVVNLKYISQILEQRKALSQCYNNLLKHTQIQQQTINTQGNFNYAYYPVVFKNEETTLKIIKDLEANWVTPRRYFYPALNTVELFNPSSCPISESIAKRILCLPIYHALTPNDVNFITRIVLRTLNN